MKIKAIGESKVHETPAYSTKALTISSTLAQFLSNAGNNEHNLQRCIHTEKQLKCTESLHVPSSNRYDQCKEKRSVMVTDHIYTSLQ